VTTYVPDLTARRPYVGWPLIVALGLVAVLLAGVAGYAIAGGFSSDSSTGQGVSDRVMDAWATGDTTAIEAAYAPGVQLVLIYDELEEVIASNRSEISAAIRGAIGMGNTYTQIGPVATYVGPDGDLYVSSLVEVKGAGHPDGSPLIGFYRVRDGRVTRQIFLDAEHY
jgi:hypothetical protein